MNINLFKTVFILLLLLAPLGCHKNTRSPKPIKVAIGLSQPPYIIAEEKRGIEYDIVKESLQNVGYELVPVFVKYAEVPNQLLEKRVDGAMTLKTNSVANSDTSDVYIVYHNYAITKKISNLKVNSIDDLDGMSVSAFQNAEFILGSDFENMTKNNPKYYEIAQQYQQNVELYKGMADVVISDKNIFKWYKSDPRVLAFGDLDNKVEYHNIFPPTNYRMAFVNSKYRDDFNKGLKQLKSSGRYQEIIDSYHIED